MIPAAIVYFVVHALGFCHMIHAERTGSFWNEAGAGGCVFFFALERGLASRGDNLFFGAQGSRTAILVLLETYLRSLSALQ